MSQLLSISQIQTQFPSEWVLLEDPETNNALELQSGRVLAHSKDRDEVYRLAVKLRPKRSAILYTVNWSGGHHAGAPSIGYGRQFNRG
jgi:hypothetical protein